MTKLLARIRFGVAVVLATLTPGVAYLWAELNLSGYTYNDDGSRNLSHLAKASSFQIFALFWSLLALIIGAGTLMLARRAGPLTAPRVLRTTMKGAAPIGAVVFAVVAITALGSPAPLTGLAVGAGLAAVGVLGALLLALQFALVAGLPFRQPSALAIPARFTWVDATVLTAALGAILAAALWIQGLRAWWALNPCNCG